MENPRAEKVAVVDEVRERFSAAGAALLTEYRGLDVAAICAAAPRAARGRRRVQDLQEHARALRRPRPRPRDRRAAHRARPRSPSSTATPAAVAKALRDYARTNPALVVKGGVLGTKPLSRRRGPRRWPSCRPARCCWPSWPARMAAPMQQFAGLLAGPAPQLRLRAARR